jgi:sulfonate transport system permease protein
MPGGAMRVPFAAFNKFGQSDGPWPALLGLIFPLLFLVIWQTACATGAIDTGVWASPGAVLRAGRAALQDGSLAEDLRASLGRDFAGLAIGIPAGIAAGAALSLSRLGSRLFEPGISALRQVALFTWVPLISVWIGSDEPGKIFFIAFAVFFPVMLNTQYGVRGTDRHLLEVARVLRLTRLQTLRRVIAPAALPGVLAGIHVALVYGWLATIGAEYLFSAGPGIGSALMTGRAQFRMDQVIVGMLAIAAVGMGLNFAAGWAERRLLRTRGL